MAFMKRVRLDDELISQGICADRADALRTLMAGLVSSGGERLTSPGLKVTPGLPLHVKGRIPYVGRGGLKLEGALDAFCIDPTGLACLDVGCSTGGFTDCLLKRGAATVVSVDVGRAQFDWSLRQDDRVTLHERTNVTRLPELGYGGAIDLAVCDVSFTSIANIIDAVLAGLRQPAQARVVVDRAEAIARALRDAHPRDVVLIAGKGHEDYQEVRGQRLPFSDQTLALQALRQRMEAAA